MGEKQRAQETGEDLERKTNWEYSIEDNEKWDKKQKRKESRAQFAFTGSSSFFASSLFLPRLTLLVSPLQITTMLPDGNTRRCATPPSSFSHPLSRSRYLFPQDLDDFKPDLASYAAQRAAAEQSDALVASASGGALIATNNSGLYRDANSFVYADHKPTEDQIDRVIGKLNTECVPFSTLPLRLAHDDTD